MCDLFGQMQYKADTHITPSRIAIISDKNISTLQTDVCLYVCCYFFISSRITKKTKKKKKQKKKNK